MSADHVREIAQAILYEGYLLWPYRRSALKNQQRFTFGGIYPHAFARRESERSAVRMECLVEAAPRASIEVSLRFLHLVARQPLARARDGWREVDELHAGGQRHLAWEEATEREVSAGELAVGAGSLRRTTPADVPAGELVEALDDSSALKRSWEALEGSLEVAVARVGAGFARLTVQVINRSRSDALERAQALRHSYLSAHVVARCDGGAFVSLTDPPAALARLAESCRNEGLWPVLAGEDGRRDTMLGSPIILSDHPRVAPESPGDLFDGGEIDALLIHSIRALTEAEREEMSATDERARTILDRSLALSPEQMLRLYGAVREMRGVDG
jgi:hypothetical protein